MRRLSVAKPLAGLVLLVLVGGCNTSAYRAVASSFGDVTKQTVLAQKKDLADLHTQEVTEQRLGWAKSGTRFGLIGCNDLNDDPTEFDQCRLVSFDGATIKDADKFQDLVELGDALIAYSDALIALTADHKADVDAYSKSLADLAQSLAGLDAVLAKPTGTEAVSPAKFAAVGDIFSALGNLYEEQARTAALRRLVIAGEPIVTATIDRLTSADLIAKSRRLVRLRDKTETDTFAMNAAIVGKMPIAKITDLQTAVFNDYAALETEARAPSPFASLSKAHVELVKAARRGASGRELMAALVSIATAAETIKKSVETLEK